MKIPDDIVTFKRLFDSQNKELFIVGGAVRDYLMKLKPHDFDLVTDAFPNEIKSILEGYRMDYTGEHFGVIRVYTEQNPLGYEIATYREDVTVGRKPEVRMGATMKEDAMRRDFTFNALYADIDPIKSTMGAIVDYVDGENDIKKMIIKTPGRTEDRFDEDRLRILRAVRFASRLGFTYSTDIRSAIEKNPALAGTSNDGKMERISQERIYEEFVKGISQSLSVERYVQDLIQFGLMEQILHFKFEKDDLPVFYSRHIESMVYSILKASKEWYTSDHGPKHLMEKCMFSSKLAHGVIMLYMLDVMNEDDAMHLFKYMNKTDLTTKIIRLNMNVFDEGSKKMIRAFCHYSITTSGDELMKQGFRGYEIGVEMERIEKEKFLLMLDNF